MKICNSKKLEECLAHDELSEWEKVKYMLIPMIVTGLFGGPIFLIRPRYGMQPPPLGMILTVVGGLLVAVVTYWGIKRLYRANIAIDGEDFIVRYTVLSLPVFFKFTAGLVPGFIILFLVSAALTHRHKELRQYVPIFCNVIFPLLMVWYYDLVNKSFKRFGEKRKKGVSKQKGVSL